MIFLLAAADYGYHRLRLRLKTCGACRRHSTAAIHIITIAYIIYQISLHLALHILLQVGEHAYGRAVPATFTLRHVHGQHGQLFIDQRMLLTEPL